MKCVMCNYTNVCREKFVEHIVNDHETLDNNRKRMSCHMCDFKTRLIREMEEHVVTAHQSIEWDQSSFGGDIPVNKKQKSSIDEILEFSCQSCPFISTDKMEVVQHFMERHIDRNVINKTSESNFKTNESEEKKLMYRGEKMIPLVKTSFKTSKSKVLHCRRCDFKTPLRTKFAAHLAKKHRHLLQENDNNLDAEFDETGGAAEDSNTDIDTSSSSAKIAASESQSNPNERQMFECPHCLFKTFDSDKLTSHVIKTHSELTPIEAEAKTKSLVKSSHKTDINNSARQSYGGKQLIGKQKSHISHPKESSSDDSSDKENQAPKCQDKPKSNTPWISLSDAIFATQTVKTAQDEPGQQESVGADLGRRSSRRLSKKLEKEKREQSGSGASSTAMAGKKDAEKKNCDKPLLPLGMKYEEFKCSKCCTFSTIKLYLLARHFGTCSGREKLPKKNEATISDAKVSKDSAANAPNNASKDSGQDSCNKISGGINRTEAPYFYSSLQKLDNDKTFFSTSTEAQQSSSTSCSKAKNMDSEAPNTGDERSGAVEGSFATLSLDKIGQNENEELNGQVVNAQDSKKTPVRVENVSVTSTSGSVVKGKDNSATLEDNHIQVGSLEKDDSTQPPGSGEKPPSIRKIFCSKCTFSAASLKLLAMHYVTCNGKL